MSGPPIARAIILTDDGAVDYTEVLAAFDGTGADTIATLTNTLGTSTTVLGSSLDGFAALAAQLDAANATAIAHYSHIGA